MIRINFEPNLLTGDRAEEWLYWKQKAHDATAEIIRNWQLGADPMITSAHERIYRDLRNWLLDFVFNGKCAYCERKMIKNKEQAAAEHYRPKLAVRMMKSEGGGHVLARGPDGEPAKHPGYFWLALDWRNIVPSCAGCNALQGKLNQFPVSGDHCYAVQLTDQEIAAIGEEPTPVPGHSQLYFLGSSELNRRERPLLLHPYFDDPSEHLSFDQYGTLTGLSDKGKVSRIVFNLDEDGLRGQRELVWFDAEVEARTEVKRLRNAGIPREQAVRDVRARYAEACPAGREYAAVYRAAIEHSCHQLLEQPSVLPGSGEALPA